MWQIGTYSARYSNDLAESVDVCSATVGKADQCSEVISCRIDCAVRSCTERVRLSITARKEPTDNLAGGVDSKHRTFF